MGQVQKDSLDSLILKPGRFYPLLARLHDEGLIDMMGNKPAGKSGKDRMHYAISPLGKIRLQEEFQRLHHAVEIIQHSGLAPTQTPTDIQRLMLGLASAGT